MLLWSMLPALAADATVGGIVTPMVAVDLPQADDWDDEDEYEVHTWARGWASGEVPRGDRWFLEARVQHHVLFGVDREAWWEGSLGESGWDGKIAGPVRARAGVLTERWGKLDLLPVADVLNPRDGRSGLVTPTEFVKQPIPMAVISVESASVRAETVLIPFSTPDELWIRGQDWAVVRQGMLADQLETIDRSWTVVGGDLRNLVDQLKGFPGIPVSTRRLSDAALNGRNVPEAFVYNGEIAERIELSADNAELGLMAGYLRTRQPVAVLNEQARTALETRTLDIALDPGTLPDTLIDLLGDGPVDVQWPRTVVAGVDGSTLVGPLTVRLDTLYQTARPVRLFYGGGTTVPQVGAGLGVDYVRGSTFLVALESRWLHLFDAPRNLLLAKDDQVQVAGGVRWSLARGALPLQLGGMYDFSFREYLIRPSVGYRVNDHVNVELGAQILGGATPAPVSLEDALAYEGGPVSYFSQNDAVTLAISLIR